jgi:hypothetical protein
MNQKTLATSYGNQYDVSARVHAVRKSRRHEAQQGRGRPKALVASSVLGGNVGMAKRPRWTRGPEVHFKALSEMQAVIDSKKG